MTTALLLVGNTPRLTFARHACDVDLRRTRTTYWTRGIMRRVLTVTYHNQKEGPTHG